MDITPETSTDTAASLAAKLDALTLTDDERQLLIDLLTDDDTEVTGFTTPTFANLLGRTNIAGTAGSPDIFKAPLMGTAGSPDVFKAPLSGTAGNPEI